MGDEIEKILILNGEGKTGHVVSDFYKKKEFTTQNVPLSKILDTRNNNYIDSFNNLESLILKGNFKYILNFARIINEEAENNKFLAIQINSLLPNFLERITRNINTKIIHFSTDCVFSGKEGPYSEKDLKDGESFYSLTRNIGEINNNKDLTIRTSIIGPDKNEAGTRLFNWFMKSSGEIEGFDNVIWNGITSIQLAKLLSNTDLIKNTGIYHLGSEMISKYQLLKLFNKHFRNDELVILKNTKNKNNKVLINSSSQKYLIPSHEEMIVEMKKWIIKNKNIYKHYIIKEKDNE